MVGIGCYGYNAEYWMGVHPRSVDFLAKMLSSNSDDLPMEYQKIVENLDLESALRFNQGDDYFASKLHFNTPSSKVGKTGEPILTKMIRDKSGKAKS